GRSPDPPGLLLEVNNALVGGPDPRALFGAISAHLRRVVAHDYTSLAVYQPDQRAFDMWPIEFTGKGLVREHMSVPVEGSPAGIAFSTGKSARFGRAQLEALSAPTVHLLLPEGIYSMCYVPLTVADRRLGRRGVGGVGAAPFSADDEEGLSAVANQVAFSVENVLAFQEIAALKDKLAAEKVYLEEELRTEHNFEDIVGRSEALK